MSEVSSWAPLGRPFRAPTGSSHNPAGKVPGIASSAQRSRRSMLGAPMRSPAFFFLQVVQDGPTNFLKLFIFFLICRSEEHTSELQSLMRISYAVFCLKKKKLTTQ